MTLLDIAKYALRKIGVLAINETMDANDAKLCMDLFNMMVAQMSNFHTAVFRINNYSLQLTTGTSEYVLTASTLGGIDPPNRIESAVIENVGIIRVVSPYEYRRIINHSATGTPTVLYYELVPPNGTIMLWPIPDAPYRLNIQYLSPLQTYDRLSDDVVIPRGYEFIYVNMLAYYLAPYFSKNQAIYKKDYDEAIEMLSRINKRETDFHIDSILLR